MSLLESQGLAIRSALFVLAAEDANWRLWLEFARPFDDKREAYRRIAAIVAAHQQEIGGIDTSDIDLIASDNKALEALGRIVKLGAGGQVQLSNNMFNGVFLPEAIILKMNR
ncbi:hypothetical protein [Phreatobacter cathodiphilus]|uniref:Uncharacterized protein n=1 Tax=Phreatobacter cathodiphilus TaxID=1868589 RepID=A0A2S0N690_9HYPH|nr:hypothetical protein [Phreatobacter cathodiphilus]AVO43658.1 hypothetical protein C6569_00375 [Phreatobacter cathodiphilus]